VVIKDDPDGEGGTEQAAVGMCGRFQDISTIDQESRDGIQFLACRNVVGGYPCGQYPIEPCVEPDNSPYYRPYNALTRAQLAKIVVISHYIAIITPPDPQHTFTDVPRNHWAFPNVETAYEYNLISTPDFPIFSPGEPTTRGDLAQAVVLAAGYELVEWTGYFGDVAPDTYQRSVIPLT
jgi:hypothetical protein